MIRDPTMFAHYPTSYIYIGKALEQTKNTSYIRILESPENKGVSLGLLKKTLNTMYYRVKIARICLIVCPYNALKIPLRVRRINMHHMFKNPPKGNCSFTIL